ncbi:MAG: hypothetical protein JW938_00500 [Candidatus Omnitrophica bacterium]|nr:hypothetical protein [Candidatus Omnitrophota bacterium]
MLKKAKRISKSSVFCVCVMVLIMLTSVSCARKGPYIHSQWKQIAFASPDLARFLAIQNVRARVLDSGNLEVSLKILNKHDEDITVRMKFIFMDKDEFALDETSWMPYQLTRKSEQDIIQNSLSYDARTYKVYIDWQYDEF